MEISGLVFDLQRYSIHDGPGIRTTVFMKGCPLRCLWCHNPEGQKPTPEIAYIESKCIGALKCLEVCPVGALTAEKGKIRIDRRICTNCGDCSEVCPSQALRLVGKRRTVTEVFLEVSRDSPFYRRSNGGVTLSGGEPLMQKTFARALFKKCLEHGIHTTLDTCGYAEWSDMKEVLEYTNLVLYDIKIMESENHKKYTGVPNDLILENAKRIACIGLPMIVTVPVIPSLNDDEENIKAVAGFARKYGIKQIRLLPYHKLGRSKYRMLGRKYVLGNISPPKEYQICNLRKIIEQCDIALSC